MLLLEATVKLKLAKKEWGGAAKPFNMIFSKSIQYFRCLEAYLIIPLKFILRGILSIKSNQRLGV